MPDDGGVNRQRNRQQKRGSQARYAVELWCLTHADRDSRCDPTALQEVISYTYVVIVVESVMPGRLLYTSDSITQFELATSF